MIIVSGRLYVAPGQRDAFEEWDSETQMEAFRGTGPGPEDKEK